MLVERQVSVAFIGIGAALVIPEYVALSRHPGATPGASLAVGAALGALGVLFGSLVAGSHPARSARVLGFTFWTLVALAFSAAAFAGGVHCAGWGRRVVFGLVGVLPLVGPILVLARGDAA